MGVGSPRSPGSWKTRTHSHSELPWLIDVNGLSTPYVCHTARNDAQMSVGILRVNMANGFEHAVLVAGEPRSLGQGIPKSALVMSGWLLLQSTLSCCGKPHTQNPWKTVPQRHGPTPMGGLHLSARHTRLCWENCFVCA